MKNILGAFLLAMMAVGVYPAVAQNAGTLSVTLDATSPSGIVSRSGATPLLRLRLKATGGDVVAEKIHVSIFGSPDFVARNVVLVEEKTNGLLDIHNVVRSSSRANVYNGIFVPNGQTKVLLLKADTFEAEGSVQVSVPVVQANGTVELGNDALVGKNIAFNGEAKTTDGATNDETDDESEEEPVADDEPVKEEESDESDAEETKGADEVTKREMEAFEGEDKSLVERLRGHILLQVEGNGEAWYVEPDREEKHYLRDGASAYEALRRFGLGVTDVDLSRIPIGLEERFEESDADGDGLSDRLEESLGSDPNNADSDGDGFDDKTEVKNGYSPVAAGKFAIDTSLVDRLRGKILLQVESVGEAWYINPSDGKRYYMTDGNAAYQIMRFLSLGITNTDLRKIRVGE